MVNVMLKVDNMHVYYGAIHAVKGVSFEVGEGEIVALIGANGAGKSTILKTVSGLMHPRSGSITFLDKNIAHMDSYKLLRHGLAHVPEGRRIFLQMTVQENLDMGAYIRRDSYKEDMERMFTLFPRLKERRKQVAGTLSGGEQQMLAMSRALMSNPKLLMLDEPSMGLAPILVDQIFDIVKELHAAGTTILLVEQNASKALEIADRAYVLETGAITLSGTGAELASSDDVRKAYLGG
jgi:branched-chain amino acid transport system ATP-binding protein